MSNQDVAEPPLLFPTPKSGGATYNTGLLPYQALRALIRDREILTTQEFDADQVQPASIDLRLGKVAYRVRASFLPRTRTVEQKLRDVVMHRVDLTNGAVLERGCVYIIPLLESLSLSSKLSAIANPKSSTGRLDIFTRLITDGATEYDRVRSGYEGPLFAEVAPRTFSALVRTGTRLNQLRVRRGSPVASDTDIKRLHRDTPLISASEEGADIKDGIAVTLDLEGLDRTQVIGYRAKRHTGLLDLDRANYYDPLDFWEPIYRQSKPWIILDPDEFYIMVSRESVTVPPNYAAEMFAFNPWVGEFRAHYAGFFDPGFGHQRTGGSGSKAVLEIRSREVPFVMEHGQTVARLMYERLTNTPDKLYGGGIGSNYQAQGLKLSKQFRAFAAE